jgi:hypothetical protein
MPRCAKSVHYARPIAPDVKVFHLYVYLPAKLPLSE